MNWLLTKHGGFVEEREVDWDTIRKRLPLLSDIYVKGIQYRFATWSRLSISEAERLIGSQDGRCVNAETSLPTILVRIDDVRVLTEEELLSRWLIDASVIKILSENYIDSIREYDQVQLIVHSVIQTFAVPREEIIGRSFVIIYQEEFKPVYNGRITALMADKIN